MKKLRPKICCEICGYTKNLHRHHIIPRMDSRSNNGNFNIANVCPNCHALIHSGDIIIIGVYDTTDGVDLIWFKKGEIPPLEKEFWMIKENNLVVTLNGENDDCPDE